MTGKRAGFTLVEVLVAVFILGVVLAGLLSLITGTLRFSTASTSTSDRLRELNDVTGYLADSIRRSTEVLTSSTVNGETCDIDSETEPCFSVVVPEADGGNAINKYTQLFYRVMPRSELSTDYKAVDEWADDNTYVILEYRKVLCDSGTPCSPTPPSGESTVSYAQWYLVLDGLTFEGNTEPFNYDATSEAFTLDFRVADHRRGATRYTPADEPYELTVVKRN